MRNIGLYDKVLFTRCSGLFRRVVYKVSQCVSFFLHGTFCLSHAAIGPRIEVARCPEWTERVSRLNPPGYNSGPFRFHNRRAMFLTDCDTISLTFPAEWSIINVDSPDGQTTGCCGQ